MYPPDLMTCMHPPPHVSALERHMILTTQTGAFDNTLSPPRFFLPQFFSVTGGGASDNTVSPP